MTGVQDPQVYAEACTVFGPDGARKWLGVFREDLADHLDRVAQNRCDPGLLRDIAHRTAGRAGLLGFRALAEASARLEHAVRRNEEISAARDHWSAQARLALGEQTGTGDGPARGTTDVPPR